MIAATLPSELVSPVELPSRSAGVELLISIDYHDEELLLTIGEVSLRPSRDPQRWQRPGELPPVTPEGEAAKRGAASDQEVLVSWRYRLACTQVAWRIFRFEQPAQTLARLTRLVGSRPTGRS